MPCGATHANSGSIVALTDGMTSPTRLPSSRGLRGPPDACGFAAALPPEGAEFTPPGGPSALIVMPATSCPPRAPIAVDVDLLALAEHDDRAQQVDHRGVGVRVGAVDPRPALSAH